jgi:valyl-tRNA synthetase
MVMAGYAFTGQKPFSNVYFTGLVRDKQRRKMSKSLGNSPEPLELIAQFGADGTRMGLLLSAPAGNDILYDESQLEQGRNFCNKIWNAYRLLASLPVKVDAEIDAKVLSADALANQWFEMKFQTAVNAIHNEFKAFRLSDALMSIYKLIWDDFCSNYLEMIKPTYGDAIAASTINQAKLNFESLLKLLHPFMPFITEELYHALHEGHPAQAIIVSSYPKENTELLALNDLPLGIVTEIRNIRNSKGLSPKQPLDIIINTPNVANYELWEGIVRKLANLNQIQYNQAKPTHCITVLNGTDECFVPFESQIDQAAEQKKIAEEIAYLQGFLKSVEAKLSNEKFVANAKPDVIEKERQKKADAEEKIKRLQGQ